MFHHNTQAKFIVVASRDHKNACCRAAELPQALVAVLVQLYDSRSGVTQRVQGNCSDETVENPRTVAIHSHTITIDPQILNHSSLAFRSIPPPPPLKIFQGGTTYNPFRNLGRIRGRWYCSVVFDMHDDTCYYFIKVEHVIIVYTMVVFKRE